MATWLRDNFDVYTYIALLGPYSSGKSRVLEVLGEICFNSVLSPNISPAAIARLIEKYRGTLFLDEFQHLDTPDKKEIIKLLNSGYREGMRYVRVGEKDVEVYNVSGFKVFAAVEELVRSLQTRSIEINMMELPKGKEDMVRFTIDRNRAKELKARLLYFRLKYLGKSDENDPENLCREIFEKGVKDRRLIEISLPLYYIANILGEKEILIEGLKTISSKRMS